MLRRGRTPFEALMVKRSAHGVFANLVVFPGGTLESDDVDDRHAVLRELEEETGLRFSDVDSLVLVSRWVTPAHAPQRFDTTFYLLSMDDPDQVEVDGDELVAHAWTTPEEALGLADSDEWRMILPTVTHLRWLAKRSSVEEAIASALGADGRTLIEPRLMEDGSLLPIHLPADPR